MFADESRTSRASRRQGRVWPARGARVRAVGPTLVRARPARGLTGAGKWYGGGEMQLVGDDLVTLEVRLSRAHTGGYTVEMRLGEREFPGATLGPELVDVGAGDQADEGARLFAALTGPAALRSAWDQAGALQPRRRIRLRIDDAAPELHALAWEALRDPSPSAAVRHVAADSDTPFSRHVISAGQPLGPVVGPIKVLTAVAAPTNCADYDLAPIDRAGEEALLAAALAASGGLVEHTALAGPCTLPALAAEIERGYHVVHNVAHGLVTGDRTRNVMFLQDADGTAERVDAARLATTIDCVSRSLRLAVLMSCNTATRSPADAGFGFAPGLLAAGVPAVLAMQERVPMPTAAAFTRAFYEELWRSGEIDRAANRARRAIFAERLPGNAVPALYSTGAGLRLFSPQVPERVSAPDLAQSTERPPPAAPPVQQASAPEPARPARPAPAQQASAPERPARPSQQASAPAQVRPAPSPEPAARERATWIAFGGPLDEFKVVAGAGGCLQAFGRDDDGALRHRRELAPDGAWSEWEVFAEGVESFAVAADPRGRVTVAVVDGDGALRHRSASAVGVWAEWVTDVGTASEVAAVYQKDGGVVLVAVAEDDTLVAEQRGPNGNWDDWYSIGDASDDVLVTRNGAGQLVVFAVSGEELWMSAQRRLRGDWSDWERVGDGFVDGATVVGSDGRLHVFAIDGDHGLWWSVEDRPGGTFGEFARMSVDCTGVSAVMAEDGMIDVFAVEVGTGALRYVALQDDPTIDWTTLEGKGFERVQTAAAPDGALRLFATDARGRVFRLVPAA